MSFYFSLVTKNAKSRSFFFSNESAIITFFRRKLSKLHQKDTILHVTVTFFQKERQTRSSSGTIWLPLSVFENLHINTVCTSHDFKIQK